MENEENKTVMEEPKNVEPAKKGTSPLVIVLVIIVLALGGFDVWYFALGGNKVLSGDKEEPKQEEKKDDNSEKEKESGVVTLSEAQKSSMKELVSHLIEKNINGNKNISVSELSNQEILQAVRLLRINSDEFTEEDMNSYVKELFGNISFTHENIKCPICGFSYYKYSSGKYVKGDDNKHPGHGGGTTVEHGIYFVSAEKNTATNKLTVTYKVIYSQVAGDVVRAPENFYGTYEDLKSETNGLFAEEINWEPSVTTESLYEKAYNEAANKIPNTVATYTIENGQYHLETIQLP